MSLHSDAVERSTQFTRHIEDDFVVPADEHELCRLPALSNGVLREGQVSDERRQCERSADAVREGAGSSVTITSVRVSVCVWS